MNNKDFHQQMALRLGISPKEAEQLTGKFVQTLADTLDDESSLTLQGFGTFEVRKRLERVVVNPVTKVRQLVPPKLAISFRPSNLLKDKHK
ncbi:MAG: HU family DNA-binding protein [Prevotellaceae bacterium]|nr:HU family DNA-binding protein [Prevotellaceae bacterium]